MDKTADWTLGLINSAWFGTAYEGKRGRQEAKRIGFESLDVFIGFDPGKLDQSQRQAFIDDNLSTGLPVVSLVCTCLGLSDFNPAIRSYHIERAKNVVDLAGDVPTARNVCFVPGEYMFQKKLIPPQGEWDLVVDATRQVGEQAARRRRELAIELLPFEFAFINSLDTMERFLDAVGLDNVKATVDISHFWLMRIPPEQVARRLRGRIAHVHMSDCDGIHHGDMPPGRGNTPFGEYLGAIRDTGFTGAASIELEFPPDPKAMAAWVEEAHDAALALLKKAGVHAS